MLYTDNVDHFTVEYPKNLYVKINPEASDGNRGIVFSTSKTTLIRYEKTQKFIMVIDKTPFTSIDQILNDDAASVSQTSKEFNQNPPSQIKILKREDRDGINFAITTYPYGIGDDHGNVFFAQRLVTKFIANGDLYSIIGPTLKPNAPIPQDYLDFVESFHFITPQFFTPSLP